jgi:hypothetical protein
MTIRVITVVFSVVLSAYIGIKIYRYRRVIHGLVALKSEVEQNRETATNIIIDICHDIQSRRRKEPERYTWSVSQFSTSAHEQIKNDGMMNSMSDELQDIVTDHYNELRQFNRTIEDREKTKISSKPMDDVEVGPDGGLVIDLLDLCSDQHHSRIFNSENRNGENLRDSENIKLIFMYLELLIHMTVPLIT